MISFRPAILTTVFILIIILAIVGCQGGSRDTAVVPGLSGSDSPSLTGAGNQPDRVQDKATGTNVRDVWGLFHITIDPDTMQAEVIPLRGSQWHVNVVEFLQKPYPPGSLIVFVDEGSSDVSIGYFEVDVTLKHPFPTSPQFRGFDVRGGFLANGEYPSKYDTTATYAHPDPNVESTARLLNADGLIRWFNPSEFSLGGLSIFSYIPTALGTSDNTSAVLNPYKYFSDDFLNSNTKSLSLQEVDIDTDNRGTFSTTSSITRRYNIQFPLVATVPVFEFSYVVDASYSDPIPDDPAYPVSSFPISANTQELYKLKATDKGGTVYYENSSSFGGHLRFDLELYDWQAMVNSTGLAGEIGSVIVESPTLLGNHGGMVDLTSQFLATAVPGIATSSVANFEIMDATPNSIENQMLLFTVTSADPTDYSNPFDQPYPEGAVLAAYFMWEVPISDTFSNLPPEVGSVTGPTPVDSTMGPLNYYSDPAITDPDVGQNITVMWSVVPTGNAANFNIPANPDDSVDIDWSNYMPGVYDVNVRADDGYVQVAGTLLTVTHNNTAPTAGPVTGLTPVTVANNNENYSATITDPDTAQTLTVNWSVVASGNSPNYNIPANGSGNSLDQDWSTYDVGLYDVNLEVDDGVAPPASGTLLTVDLQNTAPTLGAISGPTSVDESDNAAQYDPGTLTDPDNNQTHTYMWSVVADGEPASFTTPPNSGDSLIIDWCTYPVGLYDIQVRVNDGYSNGTSPILDVTRGLSTCGINGHTYGGTSSWTRYSAYPHSILPRLDMSFFNGGPLDHNGIVQAGPSTIMNFDVTSGGAVINPAVQYRYGIGSGNVVLSLDAAPDPDTTDPWTDDRIATVLSSTPSSITVLDANVLFGNPVMETLTDVSSADAIAAVTIDKDAGIWAIAISGGGTTATLEHWTYIVDTGQPSGFYNYVGADSVNLTSDFDSSLNIFDMIAAFEPNYLYILEAGPAPARGVVHKVDLSTSPPSYMSNTTNVFSSEINLVAASGIYQAAGADISIDHVGWDNCDPEHCRISVMSRILSSDATEVVRMDSDMTIIDSNTSSPGEYWASGALSANASDTERYFIMPSTDHFDYWTAPGDW
ncbi:MAG TPA: hypothetical protein VGB30_09955 [bacterium]|jgi:hypothetical protein